MYLSMECIFFVEFDFLNVHGCHGCCSYAGNDVDGVDDYYVCVCVVVDGSEVV